MYKLEITGGVPLKGSVRIGGAKNAALPLMAASLLTGDKLVLSNVPRLSDIKTMNELLAHLGVGIRDSGFRDQGNAVIPAKAGIHIPNPESSLTLRADSINSTIAPYDIVRKMRASIVVLGPLLARFGECKVSLPGGCAIGTRPVDYHLKVMEELGAEVRLEEGYVHAIAPKGGLRGAEIHFSVVSVGATENALMAASLAKGTTVLHNAAREPEVSDLAHCLVKMGAKIEGIGSSTLRIEGAKQLHGAEHRVIPDRIEAGSYAAAALATRGDVLLEGAEASHMKATLTVLEQAGAGIETDKTGIRVRLKEKLRPVTLETAPYPGFATDMQAQVVALSCFAEGDSFVTETIFENRYMHVPELRRMGAFIEQRRRNLVIHGGRKMNPAEVMATDLRASFSLVIAALAIEGTSTLNRLYHIDRGYEVIEEKLRACGANVARVKEEQPF